MPDPLEQLRLPKVPVEPRPEFAATLLARIQRRPPPPAAVTVRYFVDDLDAAVAFYAELLGFAVEVWPSSTFAMLYRGDLRLLLSVPGGPHVMPDGAMPEPGGWNRISLQVADLDAEVDDLRDRGARFRNDITMGVGVRQVLVMDPAGNLVELFQPLVRADR
ncbi:MAG: VOC family protein [Acidimicrobiaceae bacterium]|nr:VOC family protein [Acidimicrobiaceae bacterium]